MVAAQRRRHWRRAAAVFAVVGLIAAGCGDDDDSDDDASTAGQTENDGDTGVELTMWTRSPTQEQSEQLVDAYNETHENQVQLTVVPVDSYNQQVATAAGSDELPDIFAADVVFVPNFVEQGLFRDITDRIDALPYVDDLAPSHIEVGTLDDAKHVVPHTLDLSVLFYNKDLYTQAGLDPEQPPTTLEEFAEHARAIRELGGATYGTYWGGDCGGCYVFTYWPSIWASGGEVMNEDGTESTIASSEAVEVFETYRSLWEDDVVEPSAINEPGDQWIGVFPEGNVGVMPMPSTTLGSTLEALGDDVVGVAPIPGPDGGESTFVGGDSIGISSTSDNADAAWNFIEWTLSEEAQVNVVAQNADVVARTDLADNEFSAADERVVLINELVGVGRTPFALNFNQAYNDPTSPWLEIVRAALFEDGSVQDALTEGQETLTTALSG
ncbi:MAG: ABC transporter substrate-binding protein [Acidimicrobiales bacterium]